MSKVLELVLFFIQLITISMSEVLLTLPATLKLRSPNLLTIITDGHPTLSTIATEVPPNEILSDSIQQLLVDMIETMQRAPGIGLAAPQVDVSKRVMVFYLPASRDPDGQGVPLTCLINPEVTPVGEDLERDYEGCLSVPGMRGLVARAHTIRYCGLNECGERIERTASGWHARVVQHEYDHLNGVLYPELMAGEDRLLTVGEMLKMKE
jgi:peptide deformylase